MKHAVPPTGRPISLDLIDAHLWLVSGFSCVLSV